MKVLVTGATGFIGQALTRKLLERGDSVVVLVRDVEKFAGLGLDVDTVVCGDITDLAAVERATRGVSIVYAIAGTFREPGLSDERYREVNVESVRTMHEAAKRNGVKRIVHCSTCGIHGSIDGTPADETHPVRPVGIYEQTKADGERLALELGAENGIEVTALRPTPVYGPGDTRLLKLFKLASRRPIVMIGDGTAGYHLVYIEDLTDAFILAGSSPAANGEAFLIGGPEIPSLNEILHTLASMNGHGDVGNVIRIPAKPVWLAGWLCEAMCRPLGVDPPLHRRRVEFFMNNRAYNIEKARTLLGYSPKVGVEDGLRRTAEWYRGQGLL
ncbi:MAG TPA: NAD-dependent epimerase/dehydratase family protein [Gammaproteobacteria bacterium]